MLGGVLSFVYAGEHRLQLFWPGDVAFADACGATPPDAVILTAAGHTQPVPAFPDVRS